MNARQKSFYTVRVRHQTSHFAKTLARNGASVFSLSVAYQHANKWLKANPTGDYFIISVYPQRPSLYRNQLTFKHPWY